jgi:hypothetical protein
MDTSREQLYELDRKRNALLGVIRDRSVRKNYPSFIELNSKTEECDENASPCRLSLGAALSPISDAKLDCESDLELTFS